MPPTTLPVHPGGLLDELLSTFASHGWDPAGLGSLRMEEGEEGEGEGEGDDEGEGEHQEPPGLGDAGKRALDAERTRRADADKARKAAEKRAKELEEQLAKIGDESKSEHEKALDTARKEADAAARQEVGAELQRERVEAALIRAAAGVLEDPQDAVIFLADKVDVGEDGRPDPKKVTAMVAKLAEQKPGLTVAGATPPPGSFDGGAREGHDPTTQQRVDSFVERMKSTA